MDGRRWVRVVGDGLAYQGPCLVHSITFMPVTANDYADIYDGRDAVSGKRFMRVISSVVVTWCMCYASGIPFDQGIYVDGKDAEVETTVVFTPLDV